MERHMPVKRIVGAALIVVGAIVAWQGWEKKQAVGSRIGEAFGSTNTTALWLLAIGAILVLAGAVLAARR
jgi:uncharacterized membrane protein